MSKILRPVFFLVAGIILLLGGVSTFLHISGSYKTTDMLDDWSSFDAELVSNYFILPPEIEVLKAEYSEHVLMGMSFIVEFKLPESREPSEWVKKIAVDSSIDPSFRRNPLLYSCEEKCDLYLLHYDRKRSLYHVTAGWD